MIIFCMTISLSHHCRGHPFYAQVLPQHLKILRFGLCLDYYYTLFIFLVLVCLYFFGFLLFLSCLKPSKHALLVLFFSPILRP